LISIYKQTTGLLNLKSVVCLQSPKAKLMTNEERSTIFNMAIAEQENITKNVEYEILKVEKLRALIFAIVLGSFAIIITIASILNIANASFFDKFPIPQNVLEPVVIGFALFELLIWYILKHCLDTGKSVPAICHYIVALVEISLPTMLILIFSHALHVYALFLPAVFMYFLIIALSGLRLNFYICIFTGAVAAIEYVLLALYIINTTEFPVEFHEMGPTYKILAHLLKGLMLLASGIITGIITNKLKNGFLKSFQSVNEKNHIMSMFGQHVSPAVMEKLLLQKNSTEGEVQNVCVMFLDIRNFTTFSESRTPQEVVAYLNSLFDFMINIVNRNHGIINKFLGDGFMAVFGAPFSNGLDSCNAVNASKEILQKLKEEIEAGSILPTTVGIGLHTGNAVTGNIGSIQRKEYTIIGDVVNLASRIESLNKQFNSQFLISGTVKEAIGDAGNDAVSLGEVIVKGRAEPVEIFKLA
jgi:adenylate cyclase